MKQRARKAEDKQARRSDIIAMTLAVFEETPYEKISMADIAERTGVSKGTLYTYFSTKEELFVTLLEEQFAIWFTDVNNRLNGTPGVLASQTVSFILTASLVERLAMVRLMSIAHTILERNIDHEVARRYKHLLLKHLRETGQLLDRKVSFLQWGQGTEFLLRAYAAVIGAYQLAEPTPLVREVIQEDTDLKPFVMRFESLVQQMLLAQIQSYE